MKDLSDDQLAQVTGGEAEHTNTAECDDAYRRCKASNGGMSQKCLVEYNQCKALRRI